MYFLEKVQQFYSKIEKTKHETNKLDHETKLLKTHEDGTWKKGTTLIIGDSTYQDSENIKCPVGDFSNTTKYV